MPNQSFPLQFAVVREDPSIEHAIIQQAKAQNILMVASGGCTSLSLSALFPDAFFVLFDINPRQIQHVEEKLRCLQEADKEKFKFFFTIGADNPRSLNASGKFESLFRSFRQFLNEFVVTKPQITELFLADKPRRTQLIQYLLKHPYWPVAFDLYFSDALLLAMFGKDAIQHAVKGSYPRYFQNALEQGLQREDMQENYFLHHIFLGHYLDLDHCWPVYLNRFPKPLHISFENKTLFNIENLSQFDVVSLSNLFDWMDEGLVKQYLQHLTKHLSKGAFVIIRQLNNAKEYGAELSGFIRHKELEKALLKSDKSLFYNKIQILERQ